MIKLKPCPFCGREEVGYFEERVRIMNNAFLMGVKCAKCGGAYMTSDIHLCPNDVFKAWNRRGGR
jgi:Lar family restriction alleviation protein